MLYPVCTESHSFLNHQGVRLDADVYLPKGEGTFPVLVMRQPYGRAIASTVVYAHPRWYAAHGYIVVVQDVAGRGTSGGDFDPFGGEIADGYDTVQWAAHLPNSNGQVGMYGFSYQGMTQLYAAQERPPALKAICPAMVAADLYSGWFYEQDAFCLQVNLTWALQLGAETARRHQDEAGFQALRQAAQNPPFTHLSMSLEQLLHKYAPFYFDWCHHSQPDDYWQARNPDLTKVDPELPMLHVGGWFDPYLRGTLDLYQRMKVQSSAAQLLLVGPWGHLPWGRRAGEMDFGFAAQNPIDVLQLRWFDHWLKGIDTGLLAQAPVNVFVMGENVWRSLPNWPPQVNPVPYCLQSDGLASMREDAGWLKPIPAETATTQPSSITTTVPDVVVHDAWRPFPSLGGHAALPGGVFERSHLETRSDALTYTSAPLDTAVHLMGAVKVQITCQSSHVPFDLAIVLSRLSSDGRVCNLTQGHRQVREAQPMVEVVAQETCVVIPEGDRLRLSLSGASFPAYAPAHAQLPSQGNPLQAPVITLEVGGSDSPCRLILPLSPARTKVEEPTGE